MTGSVKGAFQSMPSVLAARENQRLVPGYGFQHWVSTNRGQSNPPQRGVGGNTTLIEDFKRPLSFLEAARRATVAQSSAAVSNRDLEVDRVPIQTVRDDNADLDADDEANEVDPTIPEHGVR